MTGARQIVAAVIACIFCGQTVVIQNKECEKGAQGIKKFPSNHYSTCPEVASTPGYLMVPYGLPL